MISANRPDPPRSSDPASRDPGSNALGPPTLGVVLAGGLARRMGGGDKALLAIAGRFILARIVERLAPQCEALVLNANGDASRFAGFGLTVVPDGVPDHPGPLAGILAALDWAAAHRPDLAWIATVAADTPFLPGDLVARLHAARAEAGAGLACGRSAGRAHPLHGLWPVGLRDELRSALVESGERRVRPWMESRGLAFATWGATPFDPFFNANDAADLAEAERLAVLADGILADQASSNP